MKKYRKHIISIAVVVVMFVFALGTSHLVSAELTIINNSSEILKFRITRRPIWNIFEYTEEFTLVEDERITLKTFEDTNTIPYPDRYISSINIYSKEEEIIKEYNINDEENISKLIFQLNEKRKNVWYYFLEITNELLE